MGYGIPNFECTSQLLNVRDTPTPFTPEKWLIATPNPFNNELRLSASPNTSGYADLRLTDMAGRQVFAVQYYLYKSYNTPFSISTPELPAGLYVLKAVTGTQQQVLKVEKR